MNDGKKKLDITGMAGLSSGILSIFCIIISFLAYTGIKIFSLQIESVLIIVFLIIALSLAIIGIILGIDGRKRWALGQSTDGNISGTNAIVTGIVTIGCSALLFLIVQIQGGSELLIKEAEKKPYAARLEQLQKEKIKKTADLVEMILPHAKSYAKYMADDSARPSIEKFAVKYGFERKDAWGNDIIIKFSKKLGKNGSFLEWSADVSSAGPDGKPGTEDDIKPEKK